MSQFSNPVRQALLCFTFGAVLFLGRSGAARAGDEKNCVKDPIREDRIALVVGNSTYPEPVSGVKDAEDMACYLKQVGFTVMTPVLDRDAATIQIALDELGRKIQKMQEEKKKLRAVFFYFSGHGVQNQGENFLIPKAASYSYKELVPLTKVFSTLSILGPEVVKIVILDACRNLNAIEIDGEKPEKEGLAKVEEESLGRNTIVGLSTLFNESAASGKPDGHSPYTEVLLKSLREPGLELRALLNRVSSEVAHAPDSAQIPWDEGGQNFDADFYLRDAVRIHAQIQMADDNVLLLVNGRYLAAGKPDKKPIEVDPIDLHAGDNLIEARVFNDRTYRNQHPWESAEGWSYRLQLLQGEKVLATWPNESGPAGPAVVFPEGPQHGKWFTVARASYYVDPETGDLRAGQPDLEVWKRAGSDMDDRDQLDVGFLCKIEVPDLFFLHPATQTLLLVGGPKRLAGKVDTCFSGPVKLDILGAAAGVVLDKSKFKVPDVLRKTIEARCGKDLFYALEDHPVAKLKEEGLADLPLCGG